MTSTLLSVGNSGGCDTGLALGVGAARLAFSNPAVPCPAVPCPAVLGLFLSGAVGVDSTGAVGVSAAGSPLARLRVFVAAPPRSLSMPPLLPPMQPACRC